MNKLSIKKQLVLYGFVIQLVILSLFSYALYKALEISTLDKMESTLKVILLDIVDDIFEHQGSIETKEFDEEKEYKFEPLYIRLIDTKLSKTILQNSVNYPAEISTVEPFENYVTQNIYFVSKEHYIISRILLKIENKKYVLEVGTNYKTLNATLENFLYILIFIVPIILFFSTLGGYFLIYKSFLPIESILSNLRQINASDLSQRLSNVKNQDEIDQLCQEINALLTRLEVSFSKVSQFSSDASHELKTPLTIIRGEIEIALRKERSILEYRETLQTCLDETVAIQETIDELLFLAKSEQQGVVSSDIYLDEIMDEAIKELQGFAKLKKVTIIDSINAPMQIKGHANLIKVAFKNILKNAISFSHINSKVNVSNSINNSEMVITVEDKGIGIAKDEQTKIFETFYRTDKSRNKDSGGTGLGLSIVKKVIDLHGGKVLIISKEKKGTSVKVIFKGF